MCDPVSVGIGAGVLAAGGAVMQGVAAKKAADANAKAGRRNAKLAEDAASDALQRGEEDAGRIQMQGDALESQQRVGFAGQGVDVTLGSAARTQEDTASLTAMDVETVRNNAQREAWGLERQADNMRAEAAAASKGGNLALAAGIIGGAGSLIGAAAGGMKPTTAPKPPGFKTTVV